MSNAITDNEPKGVSITEKSWYTEIKGMTIKRAINSPFIKMLKEKWDEHYVSPAVDGELHIRENGSNGKVYVFMFNSTREMRQFNTNVFWANGYK